jgi:hypothetical protein
MECRVLALLFPRPIVVVATVAILTARNNAVNHSQRPRPGLRQSQRPAALALGYPLLHKLPRVRLQRLPRMG